MAPRTTFGGATSGGPGASPPFGRVRQGVGVVVVAVALSVLVVGYGAGRSGFTNLGGGASMRPVTAVALTAAGLVLLGAAHRRVKVAGGVTIALLGTAALADRLLGGDLRIGTVATDATGTAGLPSAGAATCMVLLGLGLVTRRPWPRMGLLAATAALSGANVLSYGYGLIDEGRVVSSTGMALHTALGFTVIACTLLATIENPMARLLRTGGVGTALVRRTGPGAALLLVGLGWAAHAGTRADAYDDAHLELAALAAGALLLGGIGAVVLGERLNREAASATELAATVRHLEATLASATDAYVGMDAAGLVQGWNDAAADLFGWTAEEAVGRDLGALLVPPAEREAHTTGLAAYDGREGPVVGRRRQVEALTRDGTAVPVEVSVWEVPAATGEARAFGAFVRDLRGEHASQRALLATQHRLELFSETANEGVLVGGPDGMVVDASPAAERLFGAGPGELTGRPVLELVLDPDRARLTERLATGRPGPVELRALRLDGTDFDAVVTTREVTWEGAPRRVSTVQDVTVLRRAQRDLQSILDVAPALISYWDHDLLNRMANRAHQALFGRSPTELLGSRLPVLLGPDTWPVVEPHVAQALAGERADFDSELADQQGRRHELSFSLVPDAVHGAVRGFLLLAVDVTERTQASQALMGALEDLQRSNTDLSDFAAAASHDLKSPLVSIGGFAELLSLQFGDQLGEEGREYLSFVHSGVRRLTTLVDELLEYARVDDSRPPEPVDLGVVLAEVTRGLLAAIETSEATIVVVGDPPLVSGHRSQLGQVLQNLLTNAIKFRRGPGPAITVRFSTEADRAVVTVEDDGIGIDPQYAELVFGMFKRLHGGRVYEGSGVGLALCRRIVERHGGRIAVVHKSPPGTTVRVTLPLDGDPAETRPVA